MCLFIVITPEMILQQLWVKGQKGKTHFLEKHMSHWVKEPDLVLFRGEINLCETAELLPIFYRGLFLM